MKTKITIKDFVSAINFELSDTFHHQWECYGPNAYSLGWTRKDVNKEDNSTEFTTAGLVYDAETRVVYEMSVWDEPNDKVWRWINPKYVSKVKQEYKKRSLNCKKLNFKVAIDETKYEDTTPTKILNVLKRLYDR